MKSLWAHVYTITVTKNDYQMCVVPTLQLVFMSMALTKLLYHLILQLSFEIERCSFLVESTTIFSNHIAENMVFMPLFRHLSIKRTK